MTLNDLMEDNKTTDAVIRNFEIIGEASNHLPNDFKEKYKEIVWQDIVDFRNVVIHDYFGINMHIFWDIIETELPKLEKQIKQILK